MIEEDIVTQGTISKIKKFFGNQILEKACSLYTTAVLVEKSLKVDLHPTIKTFLQIIKANIYTSFFYIIGIHKIYCWIPATASESILESSSLLIADSLFFIQFKIDIIPHS